MSIYSLSDFSAFPNFLYYNINSLVIFLKRKILVLTFCRNRLGQQCYVYMQQGDRQGLVAGKHANESEKHD